MRKLLVANRGEIAIRVSRAAAELDISTVAIFTRTDTASLHISSADAAVEVPSYWDAQAIISAAVASGCDALHPGYGFLSESSAFACQCEGAGLTFVGPAPASLEQLGDKLSARALARHLGIPVPMGSSTPCTTAVEVLQWMTSSGVPFPIMLKAVGGGGGRGMRPVHSWQEIEAAFAAASLEAGASGASGGIFVEAMVQGAKHLEVHLDAITSPLDAITF